MKKLKILDKEVGQEVLALALVLTLLVAIGAVFLAKTLIDQKRINDRRRELWRAFLHAEAGIAQVQHWAYYPSSFTPDPNLFVRDPGGETPGEKYPNLQATLDAGGLIVSSDELKTMGEAGMYGLDAFRTESDWYLGRIREIRIRPLGTDVPFDDSGNTADPPSSAGAFFKIISVGEAEPTAQAGGDRDALTREVIGYATLTPVEDIEIHAPLVSLATATAFGNAKIHWGEAWSKTDFDVLNNSQMTYALSDPRVVWRTEGAFNFPANWKNSATYKAGSLYSGFMSQAAQPVGRRPGLFPDGSGDWRNSFYQNVPPGVLQWPDLASQYQEFKNMALANDRYYTTDAGGQLLKEGSVVDFYTEFTEPDRANAPMELAFIDTTDGLPPASDGSNLTTIHISGTNQGLKGFLYICANFDAAGVGNPPPLTVVNPNTGALESLPQIFLDGVIYTAGTIELGGNAGIFGSIVAEHGFVGGGTPNIFYNIDLDNGLDIGGGNLGAPFQIVLHNNFAES